MRILSKFIKIIIFLALISILYLFMPLPSDKLLYIPPQKDDNKYLALKLQNTPFNELDYIVLSKFKQFKSGWIRLKPWVNRYTIYKKILSNKREKTRVMVMYAGNSVENFFKTISKQANLDSKKLLEFYNKIVTYGNGGIIAKRYKIPYNTTEQSTISYIIYKSYTILNKVAHFYKIDIDSKEFKDALIVASIIQKETNYKKEMPLVASVIYNRLNRGLKLQMDATLNYGKYSHTPVTPKRIREDNSKYNTYKYKGLPPKPLCAVSISALSAALNPAKTNYLYFVKKGNKHIFSTSYTTHKIKVKEYKTRVLVRKKLKYASRVDFFIPSPVMRIDYKKLGIIPLKRE